MPMDVLSAISECRKKPLKAFPKKRYILQTAPTPEPPQNVCYFKDFNFKAPAEPDGKNFSI